MALLDPSGSHLERPVFICVQMRFDASPKYQMSTGTWKLRGVLELLIMQIETFQFILGVRSERPTSLKRQTCFSPRLDCLPLAIRGISSIFISAPFFLSSPEILAKFGSFLSQIEKLKQTFYSCTFAEGWVAHWAPSYSSGWPAGGDILRAAMVLILLKDSPLFPHQSIHCFPLRDAKQEK